MNRFLRSHHIIERGGMFQVEDGDERLLDNDRSVSLCTQHQVSHST